jgi:hypothetical protein
MLCLGIHVFCLCCWHGPQVMHVASSGKDASQLCFGHDWDKIAVDPVVVCDGLKQACVRVMAFNKKTICAAYAQAWLSTEDTGESHHNMVTVCNSQYDVKQPAQVITIRKFWHQAGFPVEGGFYHKGTFTTQALKLPCGFILPPGTCLHQVG